MVYYLYNNNNRPFSTENYFTLYYPFGTLIGKQPINFKSDFLTNNENKHLMYDTMSQYLLRENIDTDNMYVKVYVITLDRETLLGSVPSSTHLEADYRIIIRVGRN